MSGKHSQTLKIKLSDYIQLTKGMVHCNTVAEQKSKI